MYKHNLNYVIWLQELNILSLREIIIIRIYRDTDI